MDEDECCEATPHDQLIAEIMDCNIPKNEMGWAAAIEIGKLRERIKELDVCIDRLLIAAKMLQQNSVGCAVNHYGNDYDTHGLPSWLIDTEADIKAADAIRALKQ